MEPSGGNQRQSAANSPVAETAETRQIRCHRLPPVAVGIKWLFQIDLHDL